MSERFKGNFSTPKPKTMPLTSYHVPLLSYLNFCIFAIALVFVCCSPEKRCTVTRSLNVIMCEIQFSKSSLFCYFTTFNMFPEYTGRFKLLKWMECSGLCSKRDTEWVRRHLPWRHLVRIPYSLDGHHPISRRSLLYRKILEERIVYINSRESLLHVVNAWEKRFWVNVTMSRRGRTNNQTSCVSRAVYLYLFQWSKGGISQHLSKKIMMHILEWSSVTRTKPRLLIKHRTSATMDEPWEKSITFWNTYGAVRTFRPRKRLPLLLLQCERIQRYKQSGNDVP
jgi:hypothetical protein